MKKHLLIQMPDKSLWQVSHRKIAELIAANRKSGGYLDEDETEEMIIQNVLSEEMASSLGCDLLEWATWEELAPHLKKVRDPQPPYAEWWERQINHWHDFAFVDDEAQKEEKETQHNGTKNELARPETL